MSNSQTKNPTAKSVDSRLVHLEPNCLAIFGIENCEECNQPTRYWTRDKQTPLCPSCADGVETLSENVERGND